jgi:hypothetical protein
MILACARYSLLGLTSENDFQEMVTITIV